MKPVTCAIICLLLLGGGASGQEHGPETGAAAHHGYRNAVGVFGGAATHLKHDNTGVAVGLEYVRHIGGRFGLGVFGEYASSRLERDIIVGVPLEWSPVGGLALLVAPSIESLDLEDEETGEIEGEASFLLRLGVGYFFFFDRLFVKPNFNADYSGHWTLVYGVSLGLRF